MDINKLKDAFRRTENSLGYVGAAIFGEWTEVSVQGRSEKIKVRVGYTDVMGVHRFVVQYEDMGMVVAADITNPELLELVRVSVIGLIDQITRRAELLKGMCENGIGEA